jgi:hypothetical protein
VFLIIFLVFGGERRHTGTKLVKPSVSDWFCVELADFDQFREKLVNSRLGG